MDKLISRSKLSRETRWVPVLAQKNAAAEVDGGGGLHSQSVGSQKPASKSDLSVHGQQRKIAKDEIALDGQEAAAREAYQGTGRRQGMGEDNQDFEVL